jgi:hypothetical protein
MVCTPHDWTGQKYGRDVAMFAEMHKKKVPLFIKIASSWEIVSSSASTRNQIH